MHSKIKRFTPFLIRHTICTALRGLFLYLVVIGINTGCVNFVTHGRQNSSYWGGYSSGQKLELLQDCFIAGVDDGLDGYRHALLPQGDLWRPAGLHPAPKTISCWNKGETNEWRFPGIDLIGVIPKGTLIKISHVKVNRGWSWWAGAYCDATVYGKITDGEFYGQLVDMLDASVLRSDENWEPNPVLLRSAGKAGQ